MPKTIDNDLSATEVTFGFHTAVQIATEAIDRLHTTAESHDRVIVCEVMGRHAGWIATYAGIAGGAAEVLVPEEPFDIDEVCRNLKARHAKGRFASIVVVAEGAVARRGNDGGGLAEVDQFGHVRLGGIANLLAHGDRGPDRSSRPESPCWVTCSEAAPRPRSIGFSPRDSVSPPSTRCMIGRSVRWSPCRPIGSCGSRVEALATLKTVDPELLHGVAEVFYG